MSRLFSRQSINLSRVIWIAIKKYVPDRFKRLMFNECKQRTKHTVNKLNILGFQGTSRPSSFSFVNIFFFVNPIHCKTKITKSSWILWKKFFKPGDFLMMKQRNVEIVCKSQTFVLHKLKPHKLKFSSSYISATW